MINGKRAGEGVGRVRQDMLAPAAQAADRTRFSEELLAAVDWALTPHEESRPQSVSDFRAVLPGLGTTEQKTVKVERSIPVTAPLTTLPTGVAFARETLKKIEPELPKHIAPTPPAVVRAPPK